MSDEFFRAVGDPYLKINYDSTKRPHYFAFKDLATSLYWLVPCSARVEKFECIVSKRKERGKPSDGIRILKVQDKMTALLFQDMFPALERYIQEPYVRGGQAVRIADPKVIIDLEKTARKVISLLQHGVRFTPTQPDAMRIKKLMLEELQSSQ
ncbi:MAG: hypothetical protein FWE59_01950 [Oscillospiraceae bacterium]|nr:hypothetical protein [Oscillospiraceae bacterium]